VADFEVRGRTDLKQVARDLKAAGNGQLRRDLLRRVRESVKPALPAIRESAASTLPKRGGLADRVASQPFSVRTSLAAGRVSVVGKGMKELAVIDKGTLFHPVFGDRSRWSRQAVTPGFFTKPLEQRAPAIRSAVLKVISDVARKID
jgi:cytochrome P450